MPSPFPAMDPYLEAHWRDVHARLIIYACDSLQRRLASSLRARVQEFVVVESRQGGDHSRPGLESRAAAGVAVAEPLLAETEADAVTEPYLEIIDRARVTAELFSSTQLPVRLMNNPSPPP